MVEAREECVLLVEDEEREVLGDLTTNEDYARSYVELARSLGATKAIMI